MTSPASPIPNRHRHLAGRRRSEPDRHHAPSRWQAGGRVGLGRGRRGRWTPFSLSIMPQMTEQTLNDLRPRSLDLRMATKRVRWNGRDQIQDLPVLEGVL